MIDLSLQLMTTVRHNRLIMNLFPNILDLFKRGEIYPFQEQCGLVLFGTKFAGDETLVDVSLLPECDRARLLKSGIDELQYVQPDFLYFKQNKFLQNYSATRIAGVPDLVIEVWSNSNYEYEREMKFRLYSSSPKCEHWYLSQDSNDVQCYVGRQELPRQSLCNTLVTLDALTFDLRHLAL